MKHLLIRIIFSLSLLASAVCSAADGVYGEQTVPVGAIWQAQIPDSYYTTNNHDISELIQLEDGRYAVQFTKPGDVTITMVVFGKDAVQMYPYLIHVVQQDSYQQGGKQTEKVMTMDEYASYRQRPDSSNFAQEVLRLCNLERAKAGATPLKLDSGLQAAADVRAKELLQKYSHERPNGQPCFSIFPKGNNYKAENIAAGSKTPADVVRQWMNSPGHKANILNRNLRKIGVGYSYDGSSQYFHYWVQCFSS